MRVHSHTYSRHITMYRFEKEWEVCGDNQKNLTQGLVFARFKSGEANLQEKPGRGHPWDLNDQAFLAVVEVDNSNAGS